MTWPAAPALSESAWRRTPLLRTVYRLFRRRSAWVGLALLAAALLGALLAPWLPLAQPDAVDLAAQFQPPNASRLAGTDFFGRDLFSRLLYGGRATLSAAAIAVALGAVGGTVLGLAAGYARGWLAALAAGLIDLLLAFPALLLALLVVALLGPGLRTLAVAVGVAGIPVYARLVRSVMIKNREALYVQAADALGAGAGRILFRHLLPGVAGPLVSWITLDIGWAILHVAGLGFLGLGVAPPLAEWGLMLYEGREYLGSAPWTSAAPGLAITLTVVGTALLGDALGDALAPERA